MKKNIRRLVNSWVLPLILTQAATGQVNVITSAISPVSPSSNQIFTQGGAGVRSMILYPVLSPSLGRNVRLRVYGKLECVSPHFTIELADTSFGAFINLVPGRPYLLNKTELEQAFANFNEKNLSFDGITPDDIRDGNNFKFPNGIYTICFYARASQYIEQVRCDDGECDTIRVQGEDYISNPGCATFTIANCTQQTNGAIINTIVKPPINPNIAQTISTGGISSTLQFSIPPTPGCNTQVKLFGKIERLSPSPFTIALNPDFGQQAPVTVVSGSTILSPGQMTGAFDNFNESSLVTTGVDLASIKDANNNIKLPDGNYRICFYARYFKGNTLGENASDPNLGCGSFTIGCAPPNGVQINTIVRPQVNPVIAQAISTAGISTGIQINSQPLCNTQVKLFGRIERISPSPFSISLNPDYQQQFPLTLLPGSLAQLTPGQQLDAFGAFNESNLITEGIELASIKDANNNIKLPDGNYRICFYARYFSGNTLGDNASDPNMGCSMFSVCYQAGGAPQFTQPVGSLNINSEIAIVQPASPVVFTWTPPQSTCGLPLGGISYDFEIRELLANQTVTDAINNPYIFRKTLLPSTTFLLDNNLYKNVLQEGKRYIMRVRAVSSNINSPVEIDNRGYSRVEAFQYGGNIITDNNISIDPQDYFIKFKERKSEFWDDVLKGYRNGTRKDTLVPIKEYIAFALTQNATAYNSDAIELFLTLNPELADAKKVKISYAPNLPVFPEVPVNDQANFDKEHQTNLEPDKHEENKFLKYLDTLEDYKQKIPANTVNMINGLATHLNSIKTQVDSVDRVSVDLINQVLSELLYELRQNSRGVNKTQFNQLQSLVVALQELTELTPNGTSFIYPFPAKKSSLSSYQSDINSQVKKISLKYSTTGNDYVVESVLSEIMKQLLPFDVIVWRNSKEPPFKPVLDAPDLSSTYRVYYALSKLYNHKNPEINAKSTSHLASTVQVSLPSNSAFTFWTLNMLNHKMTKAQDVDPKDVLLHTIKISPAPKKLSIILKVD